MNIASLLQDRQVIVAPWGPRTTSFAIKCTDLQQIRRRFPAAGNNINAMDETMPLADGIFAVAIRICVLSFGYVLSSNPIRYRRLWDLLAIDTDLDT